MWSNTPMHHKYFHNVDILGIFESCMMEDIDLIAEQFYKCYNRVIYF